MSNAKEAVFDERVRTLTLTEAEVIEGDINSDIDKLAESEAVPKRVLICMRDSL